MPNVKILVVDDDESLRRVTEVQLEREGYTVSTAATGDAALAVLENSPQDLVLSDVRMPGMSGLDLLRRVRQLYPGTAVILMSAFGSSESLMEAQQLGARDYITKPVRPDILRGAIRRALGTMRSEPDHETADAQRRSSPDASCAWRR